MMSKSASTNVVVFLEKLRVIEREFSTIKLAITVLNNTLYLKLNVGVLSSITFERYTLSLHVESVVLLEKEII